MIGFFARWGHNVLLAATGLLSIALLLLALAQPLHGSY
jgi:hypothetical protein